MVKSFSVPPTTVASGIVMYSLAVAGFVCSGRSKDLLQRVSGHFVQVALLPQAIR